MITEEQRAARQGYIGSSDAAAVCGLSRWQTPLELWGEKTGLIPRKDEPTLQKKLGNRLEEVVAELFMEQTGLKVQRVNDTLFHRDYPYLGANIDRRVVGKREGLECKTATAFKAKEWADEEIPQEYIVQCHHSLAVTGWDRWHIACLIGNQEFVIKTIERDEKVLKSLVQNEVEFWNLVETKTMPATITARDSDALYTLYPVATQETKQLSDEFAARLESRAAMIADVKQLESNIEQIENEVKAQMGTAEAAAAGQYAITWKNQKQDRLDQKRLALEQPELVAKYRAITEFRRFEAKIPKGKR